MTCSLFDFPHVDRTGAPVLSLKGSVWDALTKKKSFTFNAKFRLMEEKYFKTFCESISPLTA